MAADVTSYTVLGLKPGADRDAIEKAYRRLIKRYHPDREGGDVERAAEINRAYFELRGKRPQQMERAPAAGIDEAIYRRRAHRSRLPPKPRRRVPWRRLLLVAILAALWVWRDQVRSFADELSAEFSNAVEPATSYRAGGGGLLDGPDALVSELDSSAIAESIDQVRGLLAAGKIDAVADMSRACHRQMRLAPSARQLDRCAALDFTAVAIVGNDPLLDDGPFSASAVTAREMSAARLLSDDYLLIEARFDQVRARVDAVVNAPPAGEDQTGRTDLPARRPD
jgi:hypothetical protein